MKPAIINNRLVLAVAIVALGIGVLFADEKSNALSNEIRLNMDLNAAEQILIEYKIKDEVLFDLLSNDQDVKYFARRLSREVDLVFYYSIRANKIIGISVVYTHQPYCKLNQISVPVRSIRFEKDGSYILHCEKPYKKTDQQSQ